MEGTGTVEGRKIGENNEPKFVKSKVFWVMFGFGQFVGTTETKFLTDVFTNLRNPILVSV